MATIYCIFVTPTQLYFKCERVPYILGLPVRCVWAEGKRTCATRNVLPAVKPSVGEERHQDHQGSYDRHHRPQHRADCYDDCAHFFSLGIVWKKFSLTAGGNFCLARTSHSVGIVTINVSMLRRTCPLVKDAPNYPSSQTVPIQTDKRECRKNILTKKITPWYIKTREKRIIIIRN